MKTQRIIKCLPYVKRRADRSEDELGNWSAQAQSWSVPAIAAAYGWPTGLEYGRTIAIIELGGGWTGSDLAAYFRSVTQPAPTVTDISVDGTQNTHQDPQGDADYEVALDIQVAGASFYAATGRPANIRVYWAQDIAAAVHAAKVDGCAVCSISWGADESSWGALAVQEMEAAAIAATEKGMTIFAAAGDNDSSDGGPSSANVDCPASCPHVIGCGGTTKTESSETVWNDNPGLTNGEGTGGGYSTVFPVQLWQLDAPPAPKQTPINRNWGTGRMVPDVSANADPNTGYEIVVYGSRVVVGGTSAVAPLMAGLFAAFGVKNGFISPALWANQGRFTDITAGSNGDYSAAKGPDPCSGLGTPKGNSLASLLAKLNP